MATRKGDAAKEIAIKKIQEAFGDGFVAYLDKKIYVNVQDGPGGEMVQLAISMTAPKTTIAADAASQGVGASNVAHITPAAANISDEDRATIEELKKKLGIFN